MTGVFPLGHAYLPGEEVVLDVFEPRYRELFATFDPGGGGEFLSVLIERGREVGGGDTRFGNGVIVVVDSLEATSRGLQVSGTARALGEVTKWHDDRPFPRAEIAEIGFGKPAEACEQAHRVTDCARRLLEVFADPAVHLLLPGGAQLVATADGSWASGEVTAAQVEASYWGVARHVPCGPLDRYSLLGRHDSSGRLARLEAVIEHIGEVLRFGRGV